MVCLLVQINFLSEGEYIAIGDDEIITTGECTYYDSNNLEQTITVALAVQNRSKRATWIADYTLVSFLIHSFSLEGFFESHTDIKIGALLVPGFGLPNSVNAGVESQGHNNDIITTLYDEETIETFADSGIRKILEIFLFLSLQEVRSQLPQNREPSIVYLYICAIPLLTITTPPDLITKSTYCSIDKYPKRLCR